MRILFDQGVPAPLRRHLRPHTVETAAGRDWSTLTNGDLLQAAESAAFEVFVTTDQNLRYQHSLADRKLAIVVLMSTSWPRIQNHIPRIVETIQMSRVGDYAEVQIE